MQLGWIDFSKKERSKILSVLDLLSEKGTLDELGIATIRDGFSNYFFPGTSTIQTRAKYFLAVPYAMKQVEKSNETMLNKALKLLDEIEKNCAEILYRNNRAESGLIGKNALQNKTWVKRAPSSIYWAGLRRYGIFKGGAMSISEYLDASCLLKQQKTNLHNLGNRNDNAEENECDDKHAGNAKHMQFWKLPTYNEKWMDDFEMELTKEEGAFLKGQIVTSCEGSMLAYVLKNNLTVFCDCKSFQELAGVIQMFPQDIQEMYWLAFAFSDFVYVIRVIYNVIVSAGQNVEANEELERLQPYFAELADIDIDDIFKRLQAFRDRGLRLFLLQCQQYMRAGDVEALKRCITVREESLKGRNRAKTKHPGEFKSDEWHGGKGLDYRFYNARTIVKDIMESEEKTNAQSK